MEQQEQQLMKLEGTVEHVIYENADSGYAVFEVDAGGICESAAILREGGRLWNSRNNSL